MARAKRNPDSKDKVIASEITKEELEKNIKHASKGSINIKVETLEDKEKNKLKQEGSRD